MSIFNSPPPPPPPKPTARIWSPPADRESFAVVLGPWSPHWVHWVGKRTLPCLNDDCPRPRHTKPIQWRGYLPVAVYNPMSKHTDDKEWLPAIYAVGQDHANDIVPYLSDYPGPALTITVIKKENRHSISVKELADYPENLPSCPDVKVVLAKLWGIKPPGYDDTDRNGSVESR